MQRVLSFAQTHLMIILLGYVLLLLCVIVCFPYNGSDFYAPLYWVRRIGTFAAIFPAIELSYRRINEDMLLLTPLSGKQIINGYALTIIAYGCGTLLLLEAPFLTLLLLGGILDTYDFFGECMQLFTGMIRVVLFGFFVMSFCAGAKTMLALGITGALLYFFYRSVFANVIGHVNHFSGLPDLAFFLGVVLCFALTSYRLAIWNYISKTSFVRKHIILLLSYLVLVILMSLVVYFITFLWSTHY